MRPDRATAIRPQQALTPETAYDRFRWAYGERPELDLCIGWLSDSRLMLSSDEPYPPDHQADHTWERLAAATELGLAVHRPGPLSHSDRKALCESYKDRPAPGPAGRPEDLASRLLEDHRRRSELLEFDFDPVPPDATACYRPFHADPARWGIYIDLSQLVKYAEALCGTLSRQIFVLGSMEAVLSCVLFEVFHHEFFHHIVESSATALEIISAAFGKPKPIYRHYFEGAYKEKLGAHPHHPLEEALANAYAYNSFSFVSRVKLGYLSIETQAYQRVLRQVHKIASPGYRHAVHYAGPGRDSNYVSGGAQLIAMLFASAEIDPRALLLLSQRLMPRGHTALVEKAQVPTYLVGPRNLIRQFKDWIPMPNETYTSLFWPGDSSEVDALVREMNRRQKETKGTDEDTAARASQHRAT